MNMKLINGLVGLCAMLMASQVNAATIFAPTDSDVNFLFGDLAGGTLGMFDDSDQSYGGDSLTIDVPGIVGISGPFIGGDHIATNTNGSLTLTGSDNFILGLMFDGTWHAETSVVDLGANSYTLFFENGGSVVEVDVQVVPVPAAVWLFGSGLIGLVGVARRKKA